MSPAITRFHTPMLEPTDLIRHLGKGERHWKAGRSAHALCTTWWSSNSVPPNVRAVLQTHPALAELELIDGFFERQVDLGDARRPSQTDLMAICADQRGLAVLAVEGKVDEPFGPRVSKWLNEEGSAEEGRTSLKKPRLERLCAWLGLDILAASSLRYQLLHRAASAIIEARRYRASRAALIVHSFCPNNTGISDFREFAAALGLSEMEMGRVAGPSKLDSVEFYLGWVADQVPAPTA